MSLWDTFTGWAKNIASDITGLGANYSSAAIQTGAGLATPQVAQMSGAAAPQTVQGLQNAAQQAIAKTTPSGVSPSQASSDLLLQASKPVGEVFSKYVNRPVAAAGLLTDPNSPLYSTTGPGGISGFIGDAKKAYDRSAKVSPFVALTKSSLFQDSVFGHLTDNVLKQGNVDVKNVNLWDDKDIKKNYIDNTVGKIFSGTGDFVVSNVAGAKAVSVLGKAASYASKATNLTTNIDNVNDLQNLDNLATSHINGTSKTVFGADVQQLAETQDMNLIVKKVRDYSNNDQLPILIQKTNNPSIIKDLLLADKGYQPALDRLLNNNPADLWQLGDYNSFVKGNVTATGILPTYEGEALKNVHAAYDQSISDTPSHQQIYEAFHDGSGSQIVQGTSYKPIDPPIFGGTIGAARTRLSEIGTSVGTRNYENLGGISETVLGGGLNRPITVLTKFVGTSKPRGYVTYQGLRPWDGVDELNAIFDDVRAFNNGKNPITIGFDEINGKINPQTISAAEYRTKAINDFMNASTSTEKDAVIAQLDKDLVKHVAFTNGIYDTDQIESFAQNAQGILSGFHNRLAQDGFAFDAANQRIVVDPVTQRQLADSRAMLPHGKIERDIRAAAKGGIIGFGTETTPAALHAVFEGLNKTFAAAVLGKPSYIPKNSIAEPLITSFLSMGHVYAEDSVASAIKNGVENNKNRLLKAITKTTSRFDLAAVNKKVTDLQDNVYQALHILDTQYASYEEVMNGKNISPATKAQHIESVKADLNSTQRLIERLEADIRVSSKNYGMSETIPSAYNLRRRIDFLKSQGQLGIKDEAARFGSNSVPSARTGANDYASNAGLTPDNTIDYKNIVANKARASKIADAYDKLPSYDKKAIPQYKALAKEVEQQYDYMTQKLGIKIEFVDKDPYANSKEMFADASQGILKVLKTETTGKHPYFTDEQNNKFRAVHDFFGHAATGRGFAQDGEEAAWVHHSQMFSPEARAALTTETRGQNSWYNTRNIPKLSVFPEEATASKFAEQKVAILPKEFHQVPDDIARTSISPYSEKATRYASEIRTAELSLQKALGNITTLTPNLIEHNKTIESAWKLLDKVVAEKGLAEKEQAAIIGRIEKYTKRYYGSNDPLTIKVGNQTLSVDQLTSGKFAEAIKNEFSNEDTVTQNFLSESRIGAKQKMLASKSHTGVVQSTSPLYYEELAYVVNRAMRGDPLVDQVLNGASTGDIMEWANTTEGQRYLRQFGKEVPSDVKSIVQDKIDFVNRYLPDPAARAYATQGDVNSIGLQKILANKQDILMPISSNDIDYGSAASLGKPAVFAQNVKAAFDSSFRYLMAAENPYRWLWADKKFGQVIEQKLNVLHEQGVPITAEQANATRQAAAREALTEAGKVFYTIRRQNRALYAARTVAAFPTASSSALYRFGRLAVKYPGRTAGFMRNYYGLYNTFGVDKDGNPVDDPTKAAYIVVPGTKEMGLFADKGIRLSTRSFGFLVNAPGPSFLSTFAVQNILNQKPDNEQFIKRIVNDTIGHIPGMDYDSMFPTSNTAGTSSFIPVWVSNLKKGLMGTDSNADFLATHKMVHNYLMTLSEMKLAKAPTWKQEMDMTKSYYMQKAGWQFGSPFGIAPQVDKPGQMWQDLATATLKKYNGDFNKAQTEMLQILGPSFSADRYLYRGNTKSAYVSPTLEGYDRVIKDNPGLVTKLAKNDPVTVGLLSADLSGDPANQQVQSFLLKKNVTLPGGTPLNTAAKTVDAYETQLQVNRVWNTYRNVKQQLLDEVRKAGYKRVADVKGLSDQWNAYVTQLSNYNKDWGLEYKQSAGGDKSITYAQALKDIVSDHEFMKKSGSNDFWKQVSTFTKYRDIAVKAYNKAPKGSKGAVQSAWQTYLQEDTAGSWNPQLQQIIDRYFVNDSMKETN